MHITRLIERFLRDQDLPPTKFGRLAAGDPRLVLDIGMGREIPPEMEQKLRHFMLTYGQQANQESRQTSSASAQIPVPCCACCGH